MKRLVPSLSFLVRGRQFQAGPFLPKKNFFFSSGESLAKNYLCNPKLKPIVLLVSGSIFFGGNFAFLPDAIFPFLFPFGDPWSGGGLFLMNYTF